MKMSATDRLMSLEKAFSPSAPILAMDFFLGRLEQIDAVVEGINERGLHVIVHGERGVGKTSFANAVGSELVNVFPVKVTCNRNDNFKTLWEKAFAKVEFEQVSSGMGFVPVESREAIQLDLSLPAKKEISPLDVQFALEKTTSNLLFIFDEYDAVSDGAVRQKMADTIKSLSDNAPKVTVMLVGIARNVTQLLGEHLSIERCLRQIHLPRMAEHELAMIIDRGLAVLEMGMQDNVKKRIVVLSQGFPHFSHLLGKQSCRACIEDDLEKVTDAHFYRALTAAVDRVDESIRSQFQQATFSSKSNSNFRAVITACAMARRDDHGTFSVSDVVNAYSWVSGRAFPKESLGYVMARLCRQERGEVLLKIKVDQSVRYLFRNPLLLAYVQIKHEILTSAKQIKMALGSASKDSLVQ
jgi:Cdc6-like AAA superfamily ATPase